MPLLQPGDTVRNTYEVERLLGEGAFAEVYRVKHRFMGRQAMKVFKTPGATMADIEKDLKEALLLSALRHRNIIEVFDANLLTTARGTIGFKPPESLNKVDSCPADVWGLGATLYLLLTDKLPYPSLSERDGDNPSRFRRPIRLPSLYNINVDAGIEGILLRCLAVKPEDRYPNAVALLADLELWEPGHTDLNWASESPKTSKKALPGYTGRNLKQEATNAVREAFQVAKDPLSLMTAADLLEEAMCKDPGLRNRYGNQLELWRKGIMHCPADTLSNRSGNKPGQRNAR